MLPPSTQELRRQLIERKSEPMEKAEKRMADNYDYVVLNDNPERAVEEVVHIISAARRRTVLHRELIDRINATFAAEESEQKAD